MTSERARKGGGKEVAVAQHTSPGLTVSYTGTEDFFGPGKPMTPQAPENVAGRAFDFPANYNTVNTTRAFDGIAFPTLRAFADGYDLLRLVIEKRKDAMGRLRWVIQPRDSKEKLTAQKRNKIKEITKFWLKPDG